MRTHFIKQSYTNNSDMILKHIVKIDFLDTGLGLSSECINIYDYFYQNATAIYFHGNFLSDIGNYFELHWC